MALKVGTNGPSTILVEKIKSFHQELRKVLKSSFYPLVYGLNHTQTKKNFHFSSELTQTSFNQQN